MPSPIVGLCLVKNEADILEAMVRHNLGYLDALHVVDNDSADATPGILADLATEFAGRLTWTSDPRSGHRQTDIVNAALDPLAQATDAGQIVLLDGDEFLRGETGLFRDVLGAQTAPVLLPWVTYVPTETDDKAILNPVARITHRRAREEPQFFKTTVPRGLIGQVVVRPGNHKLRGAGAELATVVPGLSLAHFPVRSKAQLTSKILIGVWNLRLRGKRRPGEGRHWTALFDRIMADGDLTDADLTDVALRYASKAHTRLVADALISPVSPDLSYTRRQDDSSLRNLVWFTEHCVRMLEGQQRAQT